MAREHSPPRRVGSDSLKVGIVRGLSGNFSSIELALNRCGVQSTDVLEAEQVTQCSHLVLPGVGAFGPAMEHLESEGLAQSIRRHAAEGKGLLGICLGAQLLFEVGTERGVARGLGLVEGRVEPMSESVKSLRLPHTGWNWVSFNPGSLGEELPLDGYYYFNHEYHFVPQAVSDAVAWVDYEVRFCVAVRRKNIFGYQFHPEKSQGLGLATLRAFLDYESGME